MRKIENKYTNNFDIIREYVSGENDVVLNEVQEKQLKRWNFYINLKLQGELSTGEIVKKMMAEFDVQRATCFNDMGYAEALFGYSAALNKRFRIGARIDFTEEKIKTLWESGEREDHELAIRMEAILQKYYDSYPEMKHQSGPRVINYHITKNEYYKDQEQPPSLEQSIQILEEEAGNE